MTILLVLFYLLFPVLLIYLTQKPGFLRKIGAVALAFGVGMIIGTIGIFPAKSHDFIMMLAGKSLLPAGIAEELFAEGVISETDLLANKFASIQSMLISFTIPLGIPLLLFSLDLRKWFRLAKSTFISFLLALVSVVIVVFVGFFIFRGSMENADMVAGMLIGIYSGATVNVASIAAGLGVFEHDMELFVMTNTYDMFIGATCLLFLLFLGQKVIGKVLPPFRAPEVRMDDSYDDVTTNFDDYSGMFRMEVFKDLLLAILLALIIFIVADLFGAFAAMIISGLSFAEAVLNPQMAVLILVVTMLALLASMNNRIKGLKKTFQFGMYLITMFCLVAASQSNLQNLFRPEYLNLFLYIVMVVYGSLAIHVLLSIPFKIDTDTMIITSTALVYSPPFVPAVAGALKNKDVIISGLTVGILGYVLGNFLGIGTGKFLHLFMP